MYYLIIILFSQFNILFTQNIDSIQIIGNKKTQDYIILREVKQKINEELKAENIIEDKNRIYNLGLFLSVDIEIVENPNPEIGNVYMITVSENWYVFPIPTINIDYDRKEYSYGGGIAHTNFRGRHEQIYLGGTIGHVNEYFLSYENPWISGDHNSFGLVIYDESSSHHVYNIIEADTGILAKIGFYKGDNKKFKFSINYNSKVINSIENSVLETIHPNYLQQVKFEYVSFNFEYRYDTRDIYIDPNSGIFFNIKLNDSFGLKESKNIYSLETYFNLYKNLYKSYIDPVLRYKFSTIYQYSSTNLPIFRKKYIGGQGYIRGYETIPNNNDMLNPSKLIEVDNYLINTVEIQSTVIKRKEYLPKLEIGADILFFVDYGLGYNLNEWIDLSNSLFSYGIGFKIFFMGGVIKLDYAFNYHGHAKFHLF